MPEPVKKPGVSFTQLMGGSPRAVNVWISPARLAAAGIALDQVDQMLQGQNVSVPAGKLVDNNRVSPLQVRGFLGSAREVGDIVIGAPNGRPVFLKDVATIVDGPQEVDESTRFAYGPAAGKDAARGEAPAVTLAIAKKAGTNAVVVANAVLAKLEQLKRQAIPADKLTAARGKEIMAEVRSPTLRGEATLKILRYAARVVARCDAALGHDEHVRRDKWRQAVYHPQVDG